MSQAMNEYIVRETGYPGTLKREIVGELVRCKDCKRMELCRAMNIWAVPPADDWFCADGKSKYYEDDPSHPFADDVMMGD